MMMIIIIGRRRSVPQVNGLGHPEYTVVHWQWNAFHTTRVIAYFITPPHGYTHAVFGGCIFISGGMVGWHYARNVCSALKHFNVALVLLLVSLSCDTTRSFMFLLMSLCCHTAQALVFLLMSACCDTAQTLMFLLMSTCCDTAQTLVFLLMSTCCDTAQTLVFLLESTWCDMAQT